jgi:type I restriction enzyme, S subunit
VSYEAASASAWTKTTLGRLCSQRGQSVDPSKAPEKTFELYSIPSFPGGRPEIVSGKEIGSNKQLVDPRTVLLGKINPRINRAWVVGNFTEHTKLASTEWLAFPPSLDFEPQFLCYFLQQNQIRDFLASNASGVGGSLMRVKSSTLNEFPFAYPALDEQREVVAEIEKQFTRLEAGVAGLRRVQANLKRYRAAVLKAACEGKLVPTEAELARQEGRTYETGAQLLERILTERRNAHDCARPSGSRKKKYNEPSAPNVESDRELPEGWTWATWEQIAYSQNGQPFPSAQYTAKGFKLLRPGNLHVSGKVIWTEENTRCMPQRFADANRDLIVRGRELVMNLTAQSLKDEFLGRVCLTSEDDECLLNQRLARLTPIIVPSQFALYLLKAWRFRRFVDGLNSGSLIQHMFTSQLAEFTFPLAPLAEQQRIIAEVERRLSVVDELETVVNANLQRANRLRQSILQRAFEGSL